MEDLTYELLAVSQHMYLPAPQEQVQKTKPRVEAYQFNGARRDIIIRCSDGGSAVISFDVSGAYCAPSMRCYENLQDAIPASCY